jgi:acyl-CoA thioester hydrolase
VPSQAAPEVFELTLPVRATDIDELGHVNNVVYLRWVQEVAVAHWRHAATASQQAEVAWVVVRHEIDYKHAARLGDEILARTWVGTATSYTFERHTELLRAGDRCLLARARTLWCPVDMRSGKPKLVGADVRERFSVPGNQGPAVCRDPRPI